MLRMKQTRPAAGEAERAAAAGKNRNVPLGKLTSSKTFEFDLRSS
jgi:hypothetical protein